jgi:tRNA(fMet)-specific endonuclease VapC
MFLLDTNPCVVYLNGRSPVLRDRLDSVGDQRILVCSVVRAELAFGAAKSRSPDETLSKQDEFLTRFRSLSFDDAAARTYGPLRAMLERAGTMIGAHDLLIAAISVANGLTLVTHNQDEFGRVPGLLTQDWEIAQPAMS